ncbi:replication protein A 70 kDa DNA-binding subunit-like [Trichogramma pretiosum]|uniref:replication protein A 70 kDa DNA-binding subunit-like n=1 Tax=Trichogramma pretiosum TaxID=7493 RepID=UPI0006C99662|nr:replication protein A 70 kDa DNA-binding subunit-like [Trichogramma pretiosum]
MGKRKVEDAPPSPLKSVKFDEDNARSDKIVNIKAMIQKFCFVEKVVTVTPIRECNRCTLFCFDLQDETGIVRCVTYNDEAKRYFQMIKINMVLYISNMKLKSANRTLNGVDNDYEIKIVSDSRVQQVYDVPDVEASYELYFTNFTEVCDKPPNEAINVVGIIKKVSEVENLTSRSEQPLLIKRAITLIDETKNTIQLTIWSQLAEGWNYKIKDIITSKELV